MPRPSTVRCGNEDVGQLCLDGLPDRAAPQGELWRGDRGAAQASGDSGGEVRRGLVVSE